MIGRNNLSRDRRPRPRHDQPRNPGVGEGLDPESMQARRHGDGPDRRANGMNPPIFDEQGAVVLDLRSVLGTESKLVATGCCYPKEASFPRREGVGEPGVGTRPAAPGGAVIDHGVSPGHVREPTRQVRHCLDPGREVEELGLQSPGQAERAERKSQIRHIVPRRR
jgi:hypothetical protein